MSGRLILEYREGGNVTRIERDVKDDRYVWHAATHEQLVVAGAKAMNELVNAAIPVYQQSTEHFCDQCAGPYEGWLKEQYGGHWDTCPNRVPVSTTTEGKAER